MAVSAAIQNLSAGTNGPAGPAPAAVGGPTILSDRRADIDAKQQRIAQLLADRQLEGLLILDPVNLAWLTSGGAVRSVLDPDAFPGLYFTTQQRWLLAPNVESQRMFDEELDGMGFLLKEWPWHWGRGQFLEDLCHDRKVGCDQAYANTVVLGNELQWMRRTLSEYEQACAHQLGVLLTHALEASCRSCSKGETEREIAGQLAHRLMHRGASVVAISVAADGNSRYYRRHGFTSTPVERYAIITATARKYGLHATAARAFCFGSPDSGFQNEHFAACKVAATYVASSWPDAVVGEILHAGERVYQLTGFEHEWRIAPQGWITGRAAHEANLLPAAEDLLDSRWAVTWSPSVGAAVCCDTFLLGDEGPQALTAPIDWPQVSVKVSGAEFLCPNILERPNSVAPPP